MRLALKPTVDGILTKWLSQSLGGKCICGAPLTVKAMFSRSLCSPNATRPRRCGCSGNYFDVRASFQRQSSPTNSDPTERKIGFSGLHEQGLRANNRAENSHQPLRRRERKIQGFKSTKSAQRFVSVHAAVYNTFNVQRHLINRRIHRQFRTAAHNYAASRP